MLGLGTITKAIRGKLGPDEIQELLASQGLEVTFKEMPVTEAEGAFSGAAQLTMLRGAKLISIEGKSQDGDRIGALLILVPSPEKQNPD